MLTVLKSIDQGQIVWDVGAKAITIANIITAKRSPRSIEFLVFLDIFSISLESNQSNAGFRKSSKILVTICPKDIIATATVQRILCQSEISVNIPVKIDVIIKAEYVKIKLNTILAFICNRGCDGDILVI